MNGLALSLVLLSSLPAAPAPETSPLKVPPGKHVLVNGWLRFLL